MKKLDNKTVAPARAAAIKRDAAARARCNLAFGRPLAGAMKQYFLALERALRARRKGEAGTARPLAEKG
jgi:hypothetical protein